MYKNPATLGSLSSGFHPSERYVHRLTGSYSHTSLISISIRQSTLLSKCTHTASEAAAYEFTTLTVRFHNAESELMRPMHR